MSLPQKESVKKEGAKLKKGKAVEDVYLKIKNMIYYNTLIPGQKLIYKDLANRLNVSTTPVIQALKGLERSNLVRYERNKGYFVGEVTESEAKKLYQARAALEIYHVPLVVKNIKTGTVDAVRNAFKAFDKAITPENRRILILRDAQFHLKLIEYTENEIIYNILKDIFEQIYLKYRPEYLSEDKNESALKEHHHILNALENRDIEKTKALMMSHIKGDFDYMIVNLRSERQGLPISNMFSPFGEGLFL